MKLARGRPPRAQGTLGHYVVFAEMLMQIGCMAWALLLSCTGADRLAGSCCWARLSPELPQPCSRPRPERDVGGLVIGCLASLLFLAKQGRG